MKERLCPVCGTPMPQKRLLCTSCGNRLPPPESSPQRRQVPRSRWVVLGLIIVAGLIWGGLRFTNGASRLISTAPMATNTPTVIDTPTATPSPTATPDSAATATASAQAAALATTATAEVAAIVAATTETADLAERLEPIFVEEFVDNRNFWFTGQFNDLETNAIDEGFFKVWWAGRGTSYEVYEVTRLTDFFAETECRLIAGEADASCGLVFAHSREIGFYKFEVFQDYVRLFRYEESKGEPEVLFEQNLALPLTPEDAVRLQVIREGTWIRFAINEERLGEIEDATLGEGAVGISTASYRNEGDVEIWFERLAIYRVTQ